MVVERDGCFCCIVFTGDDYLLAGKFPVSFYTIADGYRSRGCDFLFGALSGKLKAKEAKTKRLYAKGCKEMAAFSIFFILKQMNRRLRKYLQK